MTASAGRPDGPVYARARYGPLLSGSARFVADVRRPGQVSARVVRSEQAHGRLVAVDVGEAAAAPGVLAVLTARDLREDLGAVPRLPVRLLESPAMRARRQPVLAEDRVRYVGEPVALVVAETAYLAEDAADLVRVEIDELPVSVRAGDGEPALWDDGPGNELVSFHGVHGDLAAAAATADCLVELDVAVQRHTGLPLETRGLLAEWSEGTLHLWGPTKYVRFTGAAVADALGVAPRDVVVHRVDVGGMFGVRGEVYPEDVLVPWAARRLGRPVGWVEDRREHMVAINHSREQRQRIRVAVAADGRLLGLGADAVVDLGAYPRPIGGRYVQLVPEHVAGPYRWPAVDVRARGIASNKTPVGTMRAPVAFEVAFARERALDVVARRLGMDPVELRLRNVLTAHDMPYELHLGDEVPAPRFESGDPAATVRRVLDAVDLPALRAAAARRRRDGELVGLGVGVFAEASGGGLSETVELQLDTTGTFVLGTSAAEVGQNLEDMARTVLAGALTVDPSDVAVLSGDSRAHDGGNGTFGSRSTMFVGSAAADAAATLLADLRARAAERLGVAEADLTRTPDGFAGPTGEGVLLKELAPASAQGMHRMPESALGWGLHLAQVSVARTSGAVRVERLLVAYDCGRAIDPESARAQLAGGAIQGLGGTLLEELRYDEIGQPLSTTFMDYLLPSAGDVPEVEVHLLELAPSGLNPLGAKGVGEAGVVGVAAAVSNAVADALGPAGDRLCSLPITPEQVWRLLQEEHDGGGTAGHE
jgi:carbon-monoxide dehydrogenase large subunit